MQVLVELGHHLARLQALAVGRQRARPSAASMRSRARSFSITRSMPGRSTLTATSRAAVVQRWRSAPARSRRWPPARARSWRTARPAGGGRRARSSRSPCSAGNGGTRSCSSASSSATSGGSRSRRVDSTWPNLTKIGPRRSSAWRRRSPRGASKRRPMVTTRASARTQRCWKPGQRHFVDAEAQQREGDEQQARQAPHATRAGNARTPAQCGRQGAGVPACAGGAVAARLAPSRRRLRPRRALCQAAQPGGQRRAQARPAGAPPPGPKKRSRSASTSQRRLSTSHWMSLASAASPAIVSGGGSPASERANSSAGLEASICTVSVGLAAHRRGPHHSSRPGGRDAKLEHRWRPAATKANAATPARSRGPGAAARRCIADRLAGQHMVHDQHQPLDDGRHEQSLQVLQHGHRL